MKEILAYSNSARPAKAEEGQLFINVHTGQTFVFKEDKWHPIDPVVHTIPEKTPSAVEKELVPEPIVEKKIEEPAPVEESQAAPAKAAAPKKKSTSKKSTKKETSK